MLSKFGSVRDCCEYGLGELAGKLAKVHIDITEAYLHIEKSVKQVAVVGSCPPFFVLRQIKMGNLCDI